MNATVLAQILVFGGLFTWLFLLPLVSAFLAKSRNQSKFLWFFLTLIFPFAIIFIAMKDKVS
jgi:hypothetical protein